jgi:hypothetical protein
MHNFRTRREAPSSKMVVVKQGAQRRVLLRSQLIELLHCDHVITILFNGPFLDNWKKY